MLIEVILLPKDFIDSRLYVFASHFGDSQEVSSLPSAIGIASIHSPLLHEPKVAAMFSTGLGSFVILTD